MIPVGAHLVELAHAAAQPWRNGGGITHELLAWPQQDGWTLRISVATIAADGPFSAFAGIERWFTVLEGPGVELELSTGTRRLAPGDAPLHFAGEDAPGCRLLDGTTRDLNFMVRRGSGAAQMRTAVDGERLHAAPGWRGLFAADGAELHIDGQPVELGAACLLWSDRPSAWEVCRLRGNAWWLTLTV